MPLKEGFSHKGCSTLLWQGRMRLYPFFYLLFLLIAGCKVGPRYEAPEIALPSEFLHGEKSQAPCVDLSFWWKQFHDPLLDEYINIALENNYDLKIAIEKITESRAQYKMEVSQLLPQINAVGNVSRLRLTQEIFQKSPFKNTSPVGNFFQLGFDASWELDFFGKVRNLTDVAYYTILSQTENFRNVYISLLSEVAQNYIQIRGLQSRIGILKKTISTQNALLVLAKSREDVGLANDIDVMQTQSTLSHLEAQLPALDVQLKQTIYSLSILLGTPPEMIDQRIYEVKNIPLAKGKIPLGLPSLLLRRRPDIREAERNLQAATSRIGAAMADLFPRFSLTGYFGQIAGQADKLFTIKARTWLIGPSFSWAIIDFGHVRANIRAENSRQRQSLYSYEQTVITALQDVENSLIAYFDEEERQTHLSDECQANTEILNYQQNLYSNGLVDFSQVLAAENALYQVEDTLIQSEQTLMTDLIAIYKSLGGDFENPSQPDEQLIPCN